MREEYIAGLLTRWRARASAPDPKRDPAGRAAWVARMVAHGRALQEAARQNPALDRFRRQVMDSPGAFVDRVRARIAARFDRLGDNTRHLLSMFETEPDLLGPFDFLRAETVHTRVIAWVLAGGNGIPGGFGRAPLRVFLEEFGGALSEGASTCDLTSVVVTPERSVPPHGRVDVWLTVPRVGDLALEVKVDHVERDNQVADYRSALWDYGHTGTGTTVFLTLDGASSSDHDAIDVRFEDLLRAWIPIAGSGDSGEHRYLRAWLKSVAVGLCGLGGEGAFEHWHWVHQARTLAFLEGPT